MALLQVRNFPDDMYDTISAIAKNERRSIAQQAVLLIEMGLGHTGSESSRRQTALERTLARKPLPETQDIDFAAMIREDRSR